MDWAFTQAAMVALFFFTLPLFSLFTNAAFRWVAVFHGIGASFTLVAATRALHLVYSLHRGKSGSAKKLEWMLWLTSGLVLISIITGNWLYIGYRGPDNVQQWSLYHAPVLHNIIMEFKEFISLYPLPLGVAAAWILHRFREEAESGSVVSSIVVLLFTCSWFCLLAGFFLGIGLAKIKMVN
ncbi:MAG: hypothetical protein H7X86_14000 [Gorillibacterium sp.]|nr:hypothetical protein [Gorillibacterium sp.]